MFTLPNILTLSRIGLIPFMAVFMYIPFLWAGWMALGLYIVICVTDYLDGFLARRWKQVTPLGTFLDPIADKVLISVVLIVMFDIGTLAGLLVIPAAVILGREFLVSGLREYLGPHGVTVPVTQLAKWKTTIQMVALGFLIIGPFIPSVYVIGIILLLVAMLITAKTGYDYFEAAWPHLVKPLEKE